MTQFRRYYDLEDIYTCDYWTIPEDGAEVSCSLWTRGQRVKPYGDGCHVVVGYSVYHCDEFMGILERNKADGYNYNIEVDMHRRQQISGQWKEIF